MDRRSFVRQLAAAAGLGLLAGRRAPGQSARTPEPWDPEFPAEAALVPADFLGLSFETDRIADGDYLVPDNESLVALVRGLGQVGTVRIGGNSSDRPAGSPPARVGRVQLERLAGFLETTGWRLIYGLNLGSGTAERAAAEAQLVAEIVGNRLLAFQIGNEPDLYAGNGLRPGGYGVGPYMQDWNRFSAAIREKVPGARFGGPDLSSDTSWLARFAQGTAPKPEFLSHHFYSEGPAGNPNVTAARMLASTPSLLHRLDVIRQGAAPSGLPLRMTEINSVWNGGQPGVSDTFAAAVWAFNAACSLAARGWTGVNFHGNRGACYSPLQREADGRFRAAPIYYGLRLFAALGPSSFFASPDLDAGASVRRFTVRGKDGRKRAVIINLDANRPGLATLHAGTEEVRLHRFEAKSLPESQTYAPRPRETPFGLDGPGQRLKTGRDGIPVRIGPLSVLVLEVL